MVNQIGSRVIPALPPGAQRALGGRSVVVDGNTLDPTLRLVLMAVNAMGRNDLSTEGDVHASRRRFRASTDALNTSPLPVGGVADLTAPGPAGPIPVRHYRPTADDAPLLVYYHGGGWVIGDLDSHDGVCRRICADVGVHVVSVDYRLAPEHPAPAAVDDAYAAFRWALDHGAELGARPGVVAVGGDSAGGNLAAVVSRLGRDDGVPPVLQLLLYPVTDLRGGTASRKLFADGFFLSAADMEAFERHYLSKSALDLTDPLVSPALAADLSGLPTALVVTAGFDVLRDEGDAYAAAMADAGVVVDLRRMNSLIHGFTGFAPLGGGSALGFAEVLSALRAHLVHVGAAR